ncbi:MAG: hypothetical protein H6R14_771 [Proteobacteria bacterium]|nr:hypothetical protein [Pseudomonadota bacterium]
MATLPKGTILAVASAFAAAKTVSAVSNASEAVFTCTAHGYSVGDILQVYSGWGRLNRRAVRVKSTPTADTFVAEKIDTTNVEYFPAGSGIGTVRKVSTWTQIPKYLNPSSSGGEPKPVTVEFMDEDVETTLNNGFSAVNETFDIDADQFGTASYLALVALTDQQTDTILKKTLKSGSLVFTPCTVALNENPQMSGGTIMVNRVSVNGNGRITRY